MTAAIDAIYNYRQVDERLATSGQPDETELAAIAAAGYEVVINLALHDDPRYSLADETGTIRSLGMAYVHIPVIFTEPTGDDLNAFFAAMAMHRGKKVWVHCAANKRVSIFAGLYLHLVAGQPLERAFAVERSVWEPNPVWAAFKAKMLATYPPARAS
jgi:uncharacterized protein (TIGR01244 family)